MKPNVLTILHYIIFFWILFLLTPPKMFLHDDGRDKRDKKIQLRIKNINQVSLAKENTTDFLHSELLFKF